MTPATVPMISPDGQSGDIPAERQQDALRSGFKPAVVMTSPDGRMGYIPRERAAEAVKAGFTVGQPNSTERGAPKTSFIDTVKGVGSQLANMGKGALKMASAAASGPIDVTSGTAVPVENPAAGIPAAVQKAKAATPEDAFTNDYERGAMVAGAALGADTPKLAQAVRNRDLGGAVVQSTPLLATAAAAPVAEGVAKGAGAVADVAGKVKNYALPDVAELTGTTPERLAELHEFPQKVENIRQSVVDAEKQAHQAASDSFPQFDKPIVLKQAVPEHFVEGQGWVDAEPAQVTSWKALQEQRSNLVKKIADESQAVQKGARPRFAMEDAYGELNDLDKTMRQAASDQGGPQGVAAWDAARAKYMKYMNDFHNTGSPLRPLLDMKPGETNAVVQHFTKPDTSARAVETLRENGVDTTPIADLKAMGNRPVKVAANEAAKLRVQGSDKGYVKQRLNESLSQVKNNELPSAAEARLPARATRSKLPSVLGKIPGANVLSPRNITGFRLESALKDLGDATTTNGSSESAGSMEALGRVAREKNAGVQYFKRDLRGGPDVPLMNNVDTVDLPSRGKYQIIKRYPDGREEVQ